MEIPKNIEEEAKLDIFSKEELESSYSINNVNDTLSLEIESIDDLYSGLNFHKDSIDAGFYFSFNTFLIKNNGDTIFTVGGNLSVEPEYYNFCTLPEFPQGVWEAYNKATATSK